MYKKLIWVFVFVVLAMVALYFRVIYPDSQHQLEAAFRPVKAIPVENYYKIKENNCGLWYESYNDNFVKSGKENENVMACFRRALRTCQPYSILIIKDKTQIEEQKIVYSLIRVLQENHLGECLIQNYYEEHQVEMLSGEDGDVSYVNTCKELDDMPEKSCRPSYLKEKTGYFIKSQKQDGE